MKLFTLLLLFITLSVFGFDTKNDNGKKLFNQHCAPCHSIDHDLVGPALKGIESRRDSVWLYKWIKSSQRLIKSGDTAAVKVYNKYFNIAQPDFKLTNNQIKDILGYIKSESEK